MKAKVEFYDKLRFRYTVVKLCFVSKKIVTKRFKLIFYPNFSYVPLVYICTVSLFFRHLFRPTASKNCQKYSRRLIRSFEETHCVIYILYYFVVKLVVLWQKKKKMQTWRIQKDSNLTHPNLGCFQKFQIFKIHSNLLTW